MPSPANNLLNDLSLLGCENILTINGILTKNGNTSSQSLTNRINAKAQGDELKVKNFEF